MWYDHLVPVAQHRRLFAKLKSDRVKLMIIARSLRRAKEALLCGTPVGRFANCIDTVPHALRLLLGNGTCLASATDVRLQD